MLIEFSFANYRSFRDMQKVTMLAAPKRANESETFESNTFQSGDETLLKTKAIYGFNASGKSNAVKALWELIHMVMNSVSTEQMAGKLWNERFLLLKDWDDEPMFFQIVVRSNSDTFRYGFQIKHGVVNAEWLFRQGAAGETMLFTRTEDAGIVASEEFQGARELIALYSGGKHVIFRPDALFLTGAALMGSSLANEVREFIINSVRVLNGIRNRWTENLVKNTLSDGNHPYRNFLVRLMKAAETGTTDLKVEDEQNSVTYFGGSDGRRIVSRKVVFDSEGNEVSILDGDTDLLDSLGSKKWLYSMGAIIDTLLSGGTLLFDEFDASLHPNLTLKIVDIFNNSQTNPNNAQLILATHDTGLLRRAQLRRDQICIVDKDKYGVSSLKTLIELKGVRKDESFEKEYLLGTYGGVAYLGQIDDIIMELFEQVNKEK